MTAAKTPRQGLLRPAESDNFEIEDFDDTMLILDGSPGIMPLANYTSLNALASSLTSAQDGNVYLQKDNGALWQWSKPSSAAGSFRKISSQGQLGYFGQSSQVSTATTDSAAGPTLINQTFVYPGYRWVKATFTNTNIRNSGSFGYSIVDMWVTANGSSTLASSQIISGGAVGKNISTNNFVLINPGGYGGIVPGQTVGVRASLRATAYGGGTSTADAGGHLLIEEM